MSHLLRSQRDMPGVRTVRPSDPEWPARLSELGAQDPASLLYASGKPLDGSLLAVAVVGTRNPTAAGVDAAESLTRGLAASGCVIVSGLAVGIDSIAHKAALEAGGSTVAIVGAGLDVDYPLRNARLRRRIEKLGTVVSEYPCGTPPSRHHFPQRNRLIAGLVRAVLVIEGGLQSGALITARAALDANRLVFAVPGSRRNAMAEGPNELIRTSQAALATKVEHLFEELAPELVWEGVETESNLKASIPEGLHDAEVQALFVLDDTHLPVDRIASLTGLEFPSLALAIAKLEVRGFVSRRSGGFAISSSGARVRRALLA